MTLRRVLNLFDAVMLVVGTIIGVGIFTTTGIVAQYIGHPGWLLTVWVVGGLVALAGALTYGELGGSIPLAGGEYVYLREAYHPKVGFLYGWACFWATFTGAIAILAIAFADYLSHFFPFFSQDNHITSWPVTISGGHILAISVIIGLSLFNYLGLKLGSRLQNILSSLKIVLILGIIWLGLRSPFGNWGNFSAATQSPAGVGLLAFCQGLVPVWFAYTGWNSITYLGEELKSPGRNIPISSATGVLITLTLYLLMNIVYIYALPVEYMSGVIRIAQATLTQLHGDAADLISIVVAISILGCLNCTIIEGARIYYAMASDGLFFAGWAKINPRYGSPGKAILGQGLCASILVLTGTFAQLLSFVMFVILVFSALTGIALFRLRKKRPDLPRPYKVWGYPVTPAVFIAACLGVAFANLLQQPIQAGWGIAVILSGFPAYWFWRRKAK